MSKNYIYIHSDTTTSTTTRYVPTLQSPYSNWDQIILAVSTFDKKQKKTQEEMEDEQAWEAYQKSKAQYRQVLQLLADS